MTPEELLKKMKDRYYDSTTNDELLSDAIAMFRTLREKLDPYFTSGNSVPVERATIKREEYDKLLPTEETLKEMGAEAGEKV